MPVRDGIAIDGDAGRIRPAIAHLAQHRCEVLAQAILDRRRLCEQTDDSAHGRASPLTGWPRQPIGYTKVRQPTGIKVSSEETRHPAAVSAILGSDPSSPGLTPECSALTLGAHASSHAVLALHALIPARSGRHRWLCPKPVIRLSKAFDLAGHAPGATAMHPGSDPRARASDPCAWLSVRLRGAR